MVDTRLPSSGSIRLRWGLPNAFVNAERPTVAELNACLDIADSVSWNDFGFGVQASNQTSDPAITAKGNVQDRGASQFGGGISFYYPRAYGDISNAHSLTYDALDEPRTLGYIVISVDGDLSTTNTPLYAGGATRNFASGDYVHVFKVMTAGYAESVTGEEAFRYTISFLPQGDIALYTVAGTGAAVVVVTPATKSQTVLAGPFALTATLTGRTYTRGLRWTTSDATKATVSQNGIVTPKAAGSVTITATFEATGASASSAVTLT